MYQLIDTMVGWFDMMKYTRINNENPVEYVANLVEQTFGQIEVRATKRIFEMLGSLPTEIQDSRREATQIQSEIRWLLFSDTIVFVCEWPQAQAIEHFTRMALFLEMAKEVQVGFFGQGLPLRGALTYGESYIHKSLPLFGGPAFVEAYNYEKRQDWSGCVLGPSMSTLLRELCDAIPDHLGTLLKRNLLPIASHPDQDCLDWPMNIEDNVLEMDWPAFVERQFNRHTNGLANRCEEERSKVSRRIANTAEFIARSKARGRDAGTAQ